MLTPEEIRRKALRAYRAYLAAVVEDRPFFPHDLRFGKTLPRGDYHRFAAQREALLHASKATQGAGYTVELAPRTTRRYGEQHLPARIGFDTEADFLTFIGKTQEATRFREALARTRERMPALLPLLARRPHAVLPYLDVWDDLLHVCAYLRAHPRPGCYLRELPVAVHTKFVEAHTGILKSLLDAVLPEDAVHPAETRFEQRYGLRYDEPVVRLRLLDERLRARLGLPVSDLSTPISEFARLPWGGLRAVIVENKMTFLTLPALSGSIALWGGGFQAGLLRAAAWLCNGPLLYWGDLDAHGFMILSQLRAAFPHVEALLMDRATLDAFRAFVVPGTPVDVHALPHLTPDEHALFTALARDTLRLEQERIPQAYVAHALATLLHQEKGG